MTRPEISSFLIPPSVTLSSNSLLSFIDSVLYMSLKFLTVTTFSCIILDQLSGLLSVLLVLPASPFISSLHSSKLILPLPCLKPYSASALLLD